MRTSAQPAFRKRPAAALTLAILLLVPGGCYAYRYQPCPPAATAALGQLNGTHAAVRVLYATDRNRTELLNPRRFYANLRTHEVKYGVCEVTIPAEHGMGRLEAPLAGLPPRAERHVTLNLVSPPQDPGDLVHDLRARLAASPRRELLVFVHGYFTSFEFAACRVGQICHDIRFDGVPVLFSWPATNHVLGYLIDAGSSEWATRYVRDFLELLLRESGAERIHILAHSMGSRIVCRALAELALTQPPGRARFDQVVLAAADLDADLFARDYCPPLVALAERVTVYVSGADWALGGSQRLHYYKRLGQGGSLCGDPSGKGRVDLVDVTAHDKGMVGHMYYGDSPRVLTDLQAVISGAAPAQRGLMLENGAWKMP